MANLQDSDGYMVLGADDQSKDYFVGAARRLSIQTRVSNTDAAGKIKLQIANDPAGTKLGSTDEWVDGYFFLAGNSSLMDSYDLPAGQPFSAIICHEVFTGFARLKWEHSSGTGGMWYVIKSHRS